MRQIGFMLLATVMLLGLSSAAQGAFPIGDPTAANGWDTTSAVSVNVSQPGYGGREWIYTINGAGLDAATGTLHNGGAPHGFMGISSGAANPRGGTINDGTYGDRWIEYSFDQVYPLAQMDIWAYNENANYYWASMTVKDVMIEISTTGGTDPSEWTTVTAMTLGHSAFETEGIPVTNSIDFGGADAKYVVITLINGSEGTYTKGNTGVDSPDFGLSEVRFFAVPEPATMTLLGLAGLLGLKRRRA